MSRRALALAVTTQLAQVRKSGSPRLYHFDPQVSYTLSVASKSVSYKLHSVLYTAYSVKKCFLDSLSVLSEVLEQALQRGSNDNCSLLARDLRRQPVEPRTATAYPTPATVRTCERK